MSILGIGIDLCEIERVQSSIDKHGELFAKKILHPNELVVYRNLKLRARYLAKRFAAKEAFAKAMGTGVAEGVSLPYIEVVNDELGKPSILLHETTREKLASWGNCRVHLSISDEKNLAQAQVIIEKLSD
ncbi:holo-ACP synthase [Aliikangiella sp. IMCC44653]